MEVHDVLVVGAGPIGLATALGLRQRGVENVLVVEQARAFRKVGQGIDLLPNGLKALKHIDIKAYEEVKKSVGMFGSPSTSKTSSTILTNQNPAKASSEWIQRNLHGEKKRSISLNYEDWVKDYGEGRVGTSWHNLQTTLRQLLPEDSVKVNHRCINVVEAVESGCIQVDCVSDDIGGESNPYAHWADKQKYIEPSPQNSEILRQQLLTSSFRAKLVVAADGINSTVRRIIYKDTPFHAFARPEYSGFGAIGCTEIADVPPALLTEVKDKYFKDSRIVTLFNDAISSNYACMEDSYIILFQKPGGSVGYLIHLATPSSTLKEKSGSELIDLALQALDLADFPNTLKQLIRLSPPANMQQRPYYIHRASTTEALQFPSTASLNNRANKEIQPPWSIGRIILVGDAAHGMPPFIAQGVNQGFEDALAVATVIANLAQKNHWDNIPAIAEAYEKYETLRRPFMVNIQQTTLKPISSRIGQEWQKYSQQVFCRNFDQVLEALL